jgi:molybdopterin synthase catalytic subunit
VTVRVQTEDFDIGAELELLAAGNHQVGGVASFIGLVRDIAPNGSGTASSMTLEHYPGMTEKRLSEIEAEAQRRWPLSATLIIHRYGRLEPGDRIVLVATASSHREAALESCAFLIDWLKTEAPFWKLEEGPEGPRWVEAKTSEGSALGRGENERRRPQGGLGEVILGRHPRAPVPRSATRVGGWPGQTILANSA